MYLENKKDMATKMSDDKLGAYIKVAEQEATNRSDEAVSNAMNDLETVKDDIGSSTDIDALAVLAAAIATNNKDYKDIIKQYRKAQSDIGGSQNVALIWTAMVSSVDIVKMYIEGTLADWIAIENAKKESSNSSSDSGTKKSSASTTKTIPKPKNTIEQVTIKETNLVFQGTAQPLGTVKQIVIHHLGGGFDRTAQSIHEEHMHKEEFDHRGIGYHYVIRWDGTIERGRPEGELGCHSGSENGKGGNTGRIGINVSGTWLSDEECRKAKCSNGGHPEPSDAQIKSLIGLIADCCKRHSIQPSRDTIVGHYELYDGKGNGWEGCPGTNLGKRLDDIAAAVANGTYGNTKEDILWTEAAPLIIEGCKLKGTINIDNIGLFPKICYLYVNLLAATRTSQADGDKADGGWAFPFKDAQIKNLHEPRVFLTGLFGEDRGDHKHEGVDLQAGGEPKNYAANIEVYAMKAGTVYTEKQWMNAVYILHNDGTWSRYLHLKQRLVQNGQQVQQGDAIGYMGGHDGSRNDAYDVHLHVEAGKVIQGRTPEERAFGNDNAGFDLLEKWSPPNAENTGYKCWEVKD